MAAKVGASAIGLDVNPYCLRASRKRAAKAGLEASIDICEFDLTKVRFHPRYEEATILYVYLMPKPIAALKSLLLKAVDEGKKVAIYCTSGCSHTPGNCIGDLVPSHLALMGMLRIFERN